MNNLIIFINEYKCVTNGIILNHESPDRINMTARYPSKVTCLLAQRRTSLRTIAERSLNEKRIFL